MSFQVDSCYPGFWCSRNCGIYSWEGPGWYTVPMWLLGRGESCIPGCGVSHLLDSRTLCKSVAEAASVPHPTARWSVVWPFPLSTVLCRLLRQVPRGLLPWLGILLSCSLSQLLGRQLPLLAIPSPSHPKAASPMPAISPGAASPPARTAAVPMPYFVSEP